MADVESEFVRHIPCGTCGSSDANSLYSDGHQFCFSCNTYIHSDDDEPITTVSNVQLQGAATALPKRNLLSRYASCTRSTWMETISGSITLMRTAESSGSRPRPRTNNSVTRELPMDDSLDNTYIPITGSQLSFSKVNSTQRVVRRRSPNGQWSHYLMVRQEPSDQSKKI